MAFKTLLLEGPALFLVLGTLNCLILTDNFFPTKKSVCQYEIYEKVRQMKKPIFSTAGRGPLIRSHKTTTATKNPKNKLMSN